MRENANIVRQDAVIEMHALSYNVRRQELETIQKVFLSSHSACGVLLTPKLQLNSKQQISSRSAILYAECIMGLLSNISIIYLTTVSLKCKIGLFFCSDVYYSDRGLCFVSFFIFFYYILHCFKLGNYQFVF